jgi:hypothetical protein
MVVGSKNIYGCRNKNICLWQQIYGCGNIKPWLWEQIISCENKNLWMWEQKPMVVGTKKYGCENKYLGMWEQKQNLGLLEQIYFYGDKFMIG